MYIRADDLEETVWSKTREVLSNPDIILSELAETSDKASLNSLDTEIRELENTLRNYERRRSNLLEAMELGEFEKDEILDRLNNIKRLRRLENLQHSTPEIKVLALDALVIKV